MKLLHNTQFISGGLSEDSKQFENGIPFVFDQPIIGYTQLLIGWKVATERDKVLTGCEYSQYIALYEFSPIYAPL